MESLLTKQFRDVFLRFDTREFAKCFTTFVEDLCASKEKMITSDGKSFRE